MRHFRSFQFRLALSAACWLALVGCDTGAVGVDSCRSIEYARCGAAAHCPSSFAIRSEDSCKRYYRDHCLHGLPLGSDPGPSKINTCVGAIVRLGDCAAQSGEDTPAVDCEQNSGLNVCQLIAVPEAIEQCSFLGSSDAGTSTGGSAGTGGTTGSAGGTESGGTSGSSGANTGGAPSTGGLPSTNSTDALGGSVAAL